MRKLLPTSPLRKPWPSGPMAPGWSSYSSSYSLDGRELRVVVLLHAPRGFEQLAERRHGGLRSNVARGPLGTRVPTF